MKAALRLDVGMAHQVADLRLFPANSTFSAHDILPRPLLYADACGWTELGLYPPARKKASAGSRG
jgi:hypothetical protein